MNKYKKLVSNTAILGLGTFSSKVLVYLLMRLYTACLTTEEYSSADLLTQTATLLMPLAVCGITDAIFRFTLDRADDTKKHTVFSTGLTIMIFSSLVFLALSPLLFFADGFFSGHTWIIIVYVLVANFHSAVSVYIRGRGEMVLYAAQGLMNTAIVIGLNILFLPILDLGVVGYVSSIMIADASVTVFLVIKKRLWKHYSVKLFDKETAVSMLRYSLPLIPTLIFWWITALSDRFMIIGMLSGPLGESGAKAANGLYSAAQKLPTIITLLTNIFLDAWNFSAVTESEDKQARADFFTEIFRPFSALLLIAGGGIILFSDLLTNIMVDASFSESARFVPILVCSTVFSGLASFLGSVYTVEKKSSMSLVTSMVAAIANIILNIILIPVIGAMGAAISTALSYLLLLAIRLVNSRAFIPFKVDFKVLITSTAIITAASVWMSLLLPGRYIAASVSLALLCFINRKSILPVAETVFSVVKKKIVNKS
ncbi:MAG: lipopolysaccharide biosynthesis protein [Clostridia bacterium]|nr:lipopolysaccharide biosynthesis protein [Clostridia bacterium]